MSVPASVVQDGLLDLWGVSPMGTRAQVERWLTETLERNLYSVTDLDARLAVVLPDQTDVPVRGDLGVGKTSGTTVPG